MVTCFSERVATRRWTLAIALGLLFAPWMTSASRAQSELQLVPEVSIAAEPGATEASTETTTTAIRQIELERLNRPFDSISLDIRVVDARMPEGYKDYSESLFPATPNSNVGHRLDGPDIVHTWEAANLWHQPLYFDDQLLERYGETPLPRYQPILSAAHFFGTIPMMPYKMSIDRPFDCVSTLGYYRPGSPTPCIGRRIPRDARAFTWESGAWLGLVFLVP